MVDYSKWDKLDLSDSDGEDGAVPAAPVVRRIPAPVAPGETLLAAADMSQPEAAPATAQAQAAAQAQAQAQAAAEAAEMERIKAEQGLAPPQVNTAAGPVKVGKKAERGENGRIKYKHNGREIYEWEQTLDDVNIYITPPPGVTAGLLNIVIEPRHLRVGLKDTPPFLDEGTGGLVKVDESYWSMDDGVLTIMLQKGFKGETWDSALLGRGGQTIDPATKQEIQKQLMLERFQEEHPGFDFSNAEFNGAAPDARSFMGGIHHT